MSNTDTNNQGIYCKNCGFPNDSDAVWCQKCGTRVREQPNTSSSTYQTQPYQTNPQPILSKSNDRRKLIIAAMIGIIVIGVFAVALSLNPQSQNNNGNLVIPSQKTQITATNINIQYGSYDEGYFGATSQSITFSNQPNGILEISPGQQFFTSFSFTESALANSDDSILSISCSTPGFSVVKVDPSTPIAFSPGSTIQITVTVQSAWTEYNGAVDLNFQTSGGSPIQASADQVVLRVDYNGAWSGAYGDTGSIQSWSGTGPYTLTLTRPSGTLLWVVSANAQKQDGSSSALTVSIERANGAILKSSSTSTAYGVAQVAVTVDNP